MTRPTRLIRPTHPSRRAPALLAVVAVCALGLAGCGDDDTASDPTASGSSSPSAPDPSTTTDTSPSSGETGGTDGGGDDTGGDVPADTVAAPIYLVGDTPQGPRLYREFQRVPAADPLLGAATALTTGTPLDPDYSSLLTGTAITAVTASPDEIVVTVDPGSATTDLSRAQARLGARSLVWTLQGVAQSRARVFVRTADGQPADLLGLDTSAGLRGGRELDVLALVNVTTPEQGALVSGSLTAEGLASSFEGTVPWQVLDASGAVVVEGFATAEGYLDGLYPWSSEVDLTGLAPGDYTFVARTDDPSGGEGPGPTEDTKTFTLG